MVKGNGRLSNQPSVLTNHVKSALAVTSPVYAKRGGDGIFLGGTRRDDDKEESELVPMYGTQNSVGSSSPRDDLVDRSEHCEHVYLECGVDRWLYF
jgi:hypothetical protein